MHHTGRNAALDFWLGLAQGCRRTRFIATRERVFGCLHKSLYSAEPRTVQCRSLNRLADAFYRGFVVSHETTFDDCPYRRRVIVMAKGCVNPAVGMRFCNPKPLIAKSPRLNPVDLARHRRAYTCDGTRY